jgi:molybdopterin-guanine dinucleotide biosynthesis protein A
MTEERVAFWPVCRTNTLHAMLSAPSSRSVAEFAELIGMRYVEFAVPGSDPFANVNTPDELAKRVRRCGRTMN